MTAFRLAVAISFVVSGACASAPKSVTFGGGTNEAMLVLSAPADTASQVHLFRRIDLEKVSFVGKLVDIRIDNQKRLDSLLGMGSYNQINSDTPDRAATLVIMRLPPGDYVRIGMARAVPAANPYYTDQTWVCMGKSAPVYEVAAGKTTIIRVDEFLPPPIRPSEEAILNEYQRARAAYPGLGVEASIVHAKAIAAWDDKKPGFPGFFEPTWFCPDQEALRIVR